MKTPEQQPNISNPQTLESEVALTRQEMEEFKKLPKEERDKQRDEQLTKLKDLQEKLKTATEPSFIKVAIAIRKIVVICVIPNVKVRGTDNSITRRIPEKSILNLKRGNIPCFITKGI